jgi:hypothetical protein
LADLLASSACNDFAPSYDVRMLQWLIMLTIYAVPFPMSRSLVTVTDELTAAAVTVGLMVGTEMES